MTKIVLRKRDNRTRVGVLYPNGHTSWLFARSSRDNAEKSLRSIMHASCGYFGMLPVPMEDWANIVAAIDLARRGKINRDQLLDRLIGEDSTDDIPPET